MIVKINKIFHFVKNNWVFACILIINVYLCTQFKHKLIIWDK